MFSHFALIAVAISLLPGPLFALHALDNVPGPKSEAHEAEAQRKIQARQKFIQLEESFEKNPLENEDLAKDLRAKLHSYRFWSAGCVKFNPDGQNGKDGIANFEFNPVGIYFEKTLDGRLAAVPIHYHYFLNYEGGKAAAELALRHDIENHKPDVSRSFYHSPGEDKKLIGDKSLVYRRALADGTRQEVSIRPSNGKTETPIYKIVYTWPENSSKKGAPTWIWYCF